METQVTGGIYEFCKKLNIEIADVLDTQRKSTNHKTIRGMYYLMLERNGFGIADIERLVSENIQTIYRRMNKMKELLKANDSFAIFVYDVVKSISIEKKSQKAFFESFQKDMN